MRIKEVRDVAAMIKRLKAEGGSTPLATEINASSTNDDAAGAKAVYDFVNEGKQSNMWQVHTTFEGELPIELSIENEEDLANLNAFEEAFLADGSLPPLFMKGGSFGEEEKIWSIFTLSQIEANPEFTYICYSSANRIVGGVDVSYIAFGKETGGSWVGMYSDGVAPESGQ